MAYLIEVAKRNCVKRLEFDDIRVEFADPAPQLGTPGAELEVVGGELASVPERPKKALQSKATQLNQDYDAWNAATPGPIFEKGK